MKRRDLIAGAVSAVGLAAANKVLANPAASDATAAPQEAKTAPELLEVTIHGVRQVPEKSGEGTTPVVFLKVIDEERYLRIYVGKAEGASIHDALNGTTRPRPMTHDLMVEMVKALQGRIDSVTIGKGPEQNVYYATIKVTGPGLSKEVDSRPSDALALAARLDTPIFIKREMLP